MDLIYSTVLYRLEEVSLNEGTDTSLCFLLNQEEVFQCSVLLFLRSRLVRGKVPGVFLLNQSLIVEFSSVIGREK